MALEFVSEILLPRLLAASVQSTLFVVVVWALCKSLPRLSASARAGLWWLVALQLVVGVLWSSPLALPLLPAEVAQQVSAAPAQMTLLAPAEAIAASPESATHYEIPPAQWAWSWSGAFAWLWLLGLSFMVARTLRGYLATRRLLRDSRACKDRTLLHALHLAAEAHGLRRMPHLRLSTSIDSPQLIGPWRPVLLLPADHPQSMHADELDMALTHELIHLQRNDLWWGLLPAAAQHLFFFHPLAHLAAREYALAREAACDAAVLAGNRHCAHAYGRLLIRLGVAPRPSAGLASASPTFHILKRRLVMLQNTASTPRVVALAILGVVAVLGVMPYRIIAAPAAETATAPRATTPKPSAAPVAAPAPRVAATPAPAPVAAEVPAVGPAAEMASPRWVPTPPAPPAPASAPAPATLPAPPAPPAPPAAARITRGTFHLSAGNNEGYVLLRENNSVMNGSVEDLREAQRLQRNGEELLWFRRGNTKYVVRDPATLERFRASYAEVARLGESQSAIGNRQSEIGSKQAAIGNLQAELGMKQAELATRRMRESEADARMAELDRQQAALDRKQAELDAPMAELDRQQAELDRKMRAADARAEQRARQLMDEAIAKGTAQPLKKG